MEDVLIVNQYLTPFVPIDLELYEKSPFIAYMNMPSTAYHIKMRAYYYDNTLQIQYSQVGPEFYSLANPYYSQNLREFIMSDRIRLLDNKLTLSLSYRHRNNKILETVADPYSQNTFTINFALMPGMGLPSLTYNYQTVGRTNNKTDVDTLVTIEGTEAMIVDNRENSKTNSTLFTINIPMQAQKNQYNLSMSLNTINVSDLLEDRRSDGYYSPNTASKSFALAFSTQYTIPLRTSFSLTRYVIDLPGIVSGDEILLNQSILTNLAYSAIYTMWPNKLKFTGGISYLKASGVSIFSNYGLNGGIDYKPKKALTTRLLVSAKVKKSTEEIGLGTLAVKLSANYVF